MRIAARYRVSMIAGVPIYARLGRSWLYQGSTKPQNAKLRLEQLEKKFGYQPGGQANDEVQAALGNTSIKMQSRVLVCETEQIPPVFS